MNDGLPDRNRSTIDVCGPKVRPQSNDAAYHGDGLLVALVLMCEAADHTTIGPSLMYASCIVLAKCWCIKVSCNPCRLLIMDTFRSFSRKVNMKSHTWLKYELIAWN